jgi:hypothetical protein
MPSMRLHPLLAERTGFLHPAAGETGQVPNQKTQLTVSHINTGPTLRGARLALCAMPVTAGNGVRPIRQRVFD